MDLYEVFCAVLYLLRTGCQWRFLPGEFPKWQNVYVYWRKWSEPDQHGVSVLEQALEKPGWCSSRETGAQHPKHIPDRVGAQSEKNTDTVGQKSYDAGKKVPGIKTSYRRRYARVTACYRSDDGKGDRPQSVNGHLN